MPGCDLIFIARNRERLDSLAKRLTDETGQAAITIVAGLSRIEALLRTDTSITLLVNNASVSAAGPLLESDIQEMDDLIALDVTAHSADLCREI